MCFGHFLKGERFGNLRLRRTISSTQHSVKSRALSSERPEAHGGETVSGSFDSRLGRPPLRKLGSGFLALRNVEPKGMARSSNVRDRREQDGGEVPRTQPARGLGPCRGGGLRCSGAWGWEVW